MSLVITDISIVFKVKDLFIVSKARKPCMADRICIFDLRFISVDKHKFSQWTLDS